MIKEVAPKPLRSRWIIKCVVLAALLAGLWYVDMVTRQLYQQVSEAQREQEQVSVELLQLTRFRSELQKRNFDIGRIGLLVPARDQTLDVVNAIEGEGKKLSLEPRIFDIAEEQVFNQQGVQIEPVGPLREIRMTILVTGHPRNLLLFLRQLEYMPYLTRLAAWNLTNGRAASLGGTRSVPTIVEVGKTPVVEGSLQAEIILSVKNK